MDSLRLAFAADGVIGEMDCFYSLWMTDRAPGFASCMTQAVSTCSERGEGADVKRAGRMRNLVFSCAVLCGLTGSASAAEQGLASYFHYSRFTGPVAAHRSLPIGSQVRVVNLDNGRSVVVRIVGRGPFIRGRVIDVSTEAAIALGFRQAGVARVRIDQI